MKKSIIALAISGLALTSVAQAAPQENSFYVGLKAGVASFHDGVNQFDDEKGRKFYIDGVKTPYVDGSAKGIQRYSVDGSLFAGYQILNTGDFGVASEIAYDYFGKAKRRSTKNGETVSDARMRNHGASVSVKGSYEVVDGLDVFGRLGAALIRTDYKFHKEQAHEKNMHSLKVSPVFAAGVEYAILPELAAGIEAQWINNVGEYKDLKGNTMDFRPDIASVNLGLTYRFGQQPAAPKIITKNFTFSSDVLFGFNKSGLKDAMPPLDRAVAEINSLGLQRAAIQVKGYTDRIGSEAYNQKLSQKRAETVANYLVHKGVSNVKATGYGEANPATGNTCDNVKGRKALISCLAKDRRVEVQVQGVKKVTM